MREREREDRSIQRDRMRETVMREWRGEKRMKERVERRERTEGESVRREGEREMCFLQRGDRERREKERKLTTIKAI